MSDRRIKCQYTPVEERIIKRKKDIVLLELENLSDEGKAVIYDNQELIGSQVVTAFHDRKIINVMVISKTQSGKTGSMCATIKQYLESSYNIIPIENIYIITGLSSIEWKDQTKERMPASIQSRVYHRCELPTTFADEIRGKKNILIIMDEIQVAAKKGQTIYKSFENAGLLDKETLFKNDIKILEYTATPDGTIYDLMKWEESSAKILASVGDGYVSSYDLYLEGRVKQYKDLCGTDYLDPNKVLSNIREIRSDLERFPTPRYHIIRTKSGLEQGTTIDNFKKVFPPSSYHYVNYDKDSDIQDINNTLQIAPVKHTFIFIKEMLRCAKTIVKQHIGILYDRYSKTPDDTTIIQGLVGRDTGYDNNGTTIVYTNIDSVIRYEQLWRSNFDDTSIPWVSKTTGYKKNGGLYGKNTFNDPVHYSRTSSSSSNKDKEPTIQKYTLHSDLKKFYTNVLVHVLYPELTPEEKKRKRGPTAMKPNIEGYFEASVRGCTKVYSAQEIYNNRRWGLNSVSKYRVYPCYEDPANKSTLKWWIVYYEK